MYEFFNFCNRLKKYFLILLLIISCMERKDESLDLIFQIPDDPISVIVTIMILINQL